MKIELSLLRADAYADAKELIHEIQYMLRERLALARGLQLDFAGVKDILNGYGFETGVGFIPSSDILDGRPDVGFYYNFSNWLYSDGLKKGFPEGNLEFNLPGLSGLDEVARVMQACDILNHLHWALTFASGTGGVKRDLKAAYEHRKMFFKLLDAWVF